MPRPVVVAIALLATVAPAATAAVQRDVVIDVDERGPVEVDLDRDGTGEQIVVRPRGEFSAAPFLTHPCGLDRRIGPPDERVAVELLRIRGDDSARPLLYVSGSTGATGRIQRTRLHRLEPPVAGSPGGCPSLTTLFRFPHRSARRPRPPRGTKPGSFSARPRDVRGRIWIRTFEGLYRRSDAGCCPSMTRTIDWRPRGDRYVRARVRVRRTGLSR